MGTGTCPGKEDEAVCMEHSLAVVLAGLKSNIKSGRASSEEVSWVGSHAGITVSSVTQSMRDEETK